MEKDGDGGDGLRHHAIRLPLTAMEGSDSEITSNGGPSVSLRQKASSIMASSAAAYRSKPTSFWVLLALSGGVMLTAFPAASLLSRLYYNGGGQSKWILSWSAVAGWPIPALLLLPCYLLGETATRRRRGRPRRGSASGGFLDKQMQSFPLALPKKDVAWCSNWMMCS